MTTRSQKRKAVEQLVSTEMETPIPETNQNLNPVAGTSKSPRVLAENLEEIRSSLRKEIMSDLTKILAENQKEMLKLIAPPVKKQTIITATEETDSESENIPQKTTSTPIKNKTTATTRKITPVNSRNIMHYLHSNDLDDVRQEGFRERKSTARYITDLINNIQLAWASNQNPVAVTVDLEKAFDSVWVDGLLWKLYSLGITGKIGCLIKDFLYRRKFKMKVNNYCSNEYQSSVGVPRGSVISPILFTIFVMDLCKDCLSEDFKYADDLTLLAVGDTLSNSIECFQRDIDKLVWWMKKWRIKASAEKTKAIIFQKSNRQNVETVPVLELDGSIVEFPSTIKVLGILIDRHLCFKEQFENSTNKAAQTLGILKRSYLNVQNFKPHTLKKLCQSFVIPQWTYLASLWGDKLKFQNSTLWSEMIALITCKTWNPPKRLLELLATLVPIDIQLESHAAKFCIKAMQQQESDPIRSLLMLNTSQIARKVNADRRILANLIPTTLKR